MSNIATVFVQTKLGTDLVMLTPIINLAQELSIFRLCINRNLPGVLDTLVHAAFAKSSLHFIEHAFHTNTNFAAINVTEADNASA